MAGAAGPIGGPSAPHPALALHVGGTPYRGMGAWGHDPKQGRYLGSWDESTRTMTSTAEMVQADGRHGPLRLTEAYETDDRRIFHMVFTRRPGTAPEG